MSEPEIGLGQTLTVGNTEIECVRDVTLNQEYNEADTTARGSTVDTVKPTTKKVSLDFELLDDGSAALNAVKAAFAGKNTVTLAAGGVNGSFYVTKMNRKEPLKDVVTFDCSAKPAYGANF